LIWPCTPSWDVLQHRSDIVMQIKLGSAMARQIVRMPNVLLYECQQRTKSL
jgi:hypothetical protein